MFLSCDNLGMCVYRALIRSFRAAGFANTAGILSSLVIVAAHVIWILERVDNSEVSPSFCITHSPTHAYMHTPP